MDPFPRRREQLAGAVRDEGLGLLVVSNPVNVSYLTNFSGESSYLLVAPDRCLLVSDGRFTEQLAEECPGLETFIRPPAQPLQQAVGETIAKLGAKNVGVESGHLALDEFAALQTAAPGVDWKPAAGRVEKLRALKDDTEVAAIREAIRFAERAWDMF